MKILLKTLCGCEKLKEVPWQRPEPEVILPIMRRTRVEPIQPSATTEPVQVRRFAYMGSCRNIVHDDEIYLYEEIYEETQSPQLERRPLAKSMTPTREEKLREILERWRKDYDFRYCAKPDQLLDRSVRRLASLAYDAGLEEAIAIYESKGPTFLSEADRARICSIRALREEVKS